MFSGRAEDCISCFKKIGMELPPPVNPAEFLIDTAAVDTRSPELELASTERVERLKAAWLDESRARFAAFDEKGISAGQPVASGHASQARSPFLRQTRVLTSRTFRTTYRDPLGMLGSLSEAIWMGLLAGWVFFGLSRDQSGIRSRQGALYNAAALQGYLILMFETYRMTIDVQLFDREHSENVVDVVPFLLSRRLARFLTEDLPVPICYCLTFYWMAGFRAEAGTFLIFFLSFSSISISPSPFLPHVSRSPGILQQRLWLPICGTPLKACHTDASTERSHSCLRSVAIMDSMRILQFRCTVCYRFRWPVPWLPLSKRRIESRLRTTHRCFRHGLIGLSPELGRQAGARHRGFRHHVLLDCLCWVQVSSCGDEHCSITYG